MASDYLRRTLGWLAILSVIASAGACWRTASIGEPLRIAGSPAPRGGLSLQLPRNDDEAHRIVEFWTRTPEPSYMPDAGNSARHLLDVAKDALRADYWFILSYVVALLLCIGWAVLVLQTVTGAPKLSRAVLLVTALPILAGSCDLIENRLLTYQLDAGQPLLPGRATWNASLASWVSTHAPALCRVASMSKFIAFMFAVLATLALAGAAGRLAALRRRDEEEERRQGTEGIPVEDEGRTGSFEALVNQENIGIFSNPDARTPDRPLVQTNVPADEPFVAFRAADINGLALSGGGIRSATFNLGLIEGLHQLNLLRLFDYVSTVSGGGYVGSMWSEWLARKDAAFDECSELRTESPDSIVRPGDLFPPTRTKVPPLGGIESDPERHLREFSRFLAPRWGFFEVEMWTALVAVLGGLLPALVIALSIIGVGTVAWLSLTFSLACAQRVAPLPIIGALTTGALLGLEYWWQTYKVEQLQSALADEGQLENRYFWLVLAALTVVLGIQALVPDFYVWATDRWLHGLHTMLPVFTGWWRTAPGQSGFERWWWVAGIAPNGAWVISPRLFDYGLVWLVSSVVFISARVVFAIWPFVAKRETIGAFDRVLMRLLGLGVLWTGLALVWHVAINVGEVRIALTAALVSGGTFAALRNWIGVAFRRPAEPGLLDRVKPYVPMVLAWVTVVLATVLVAYALIQVCRDDWLWWWSSALLQGLVLVVGLFIMPGEFGLHKFYSERISRAYSGASNLQPKSHADANRGTEPQTGDDRRLSKLVGRPLHLICCAANDLTGDPVRTLSRGARSAVLSKYGLAIGGKWGTETKLRLGEAVTASAAAFNSNMGKVSLEVGPAVSFLMTALNLRLGLWLRYPTADRADYRRWPGLLLYREMFGQTVASGRARGADVPWLMRDVHLSDGGHFENLALYELVRRHCRYIILSDCGADPEIAFDDLGNALRRIREDFGVDVELDVAPLCPVEGRSRQHVAVGTIHYSSTDRGILLYVKPTITGDEPPDVRQYKTRNTAFPHESTTDQFYDEAQWESYRNLGLHVAREMFDYVLPAGMADTKRITADWVFAQATHRWGPTPPGLRDSVLQMTERFAQAEVQLRKEASPELLTEVFPELAVSGGAVVNTRARTASRSAASGPSRSPAATDLMLLVRATELMEDVWIACELDTWWDHPLNLGWINTFARWATAPSYRFWWPLLAPMFSPGFRSFVDNRFPTPPPPNPAKKFLSGAVQDGRVTSFTPGAFPTPLSELWWTTRSTQPRNWSGKSLYENLVKLQRRPGVFVEVQVGIAAVTFRQNPKRAGWTSDDFFVPPSLWGTGLGWYFLDNLLAVLHQEKCVDCHVVVKAPPEGERTKVANDDRRSFVEHYRKMGFRQRLNQEMPLSDPELSEFRRGPAGRRSDGFDGAFAADLGYVEGADTLLVLDLKQWAAHRAR